MIWIILATALGAMVTTGGGVWLGYKLASVLIGHRAEAEQIHAATWKEYARERQGVMDKMRQEGFLLQKPAKVTEAPDIETEGLARAEQQARTARADRSFIDRAAADIMKNNPNISSHAARAEAVRLRRETQMEDPPE